MRTGIRKNTGTVLITLGALMLLGGATAKLAHVPQVVSELAANGVAGTSLIFVAALEVLSSLLFLIPATRSAGLLVVSAFLGGAIATHLEHAHSIAGPSIVLALIWLGSWLRHPEILWSWLHSSAIGQARVKPQRIAEGY